MQFFTKLCTLTTAAVFTVASVRALPASIGIGAGGHTNTSVTVGNGGHLNVSAIEADLNRTLTQVLGQLKNITLPTFPNISSHNFTLPNITLPTFPNVSSHNFTLPNITLPTFPNISSHNFTLPTLPNFTFPTLPHGGPGPITVGANASAHVPRQLIDLGVLSERAHILVTRVENGTNGTNTTTPGSAGRNPRLTDPDEVREQLQEEKEELENEREEEFGNDGGDRSDDGFDDRNDTNGFDFNEFFNNGE